MKIKLSDHFTYSKLLRFTLPTIAMMVFNSIYSVVDGLFVSNIVGSNAISSINILFPLVMVIGAFGFMFGAGGSAEVSRTLGEGKREKANEYFTLIIITISVVGVTLSTICMIFIRPLSYMLGANDVLIDYCVTYGLLIVAGTPFFMLQTTFQTFFVVAEKPRIGLWLTVASGVSNMFFDYLFIYVYKMGIAGAGLGTSIGFAVGGIIPLFYFAFTKKSDFRFSKTKFYPKVLIHSCTNGASEMLSNTSSSVVTFLYNWQLMRLAGENGVAAVSIIFYVNFAFLAVLIGFSIGTAPIFGFNYGAKNYTEQKNLFKKCILIIGIISMTMTLTAELSADYVAAMFVQRGTSLYHLTVHGFKIYSLEFLLCGYNFFGTSFFTAVCNGKISALLSFLRICVLQCGMISILPFVMGIEGVWYGAVFCEMIMLFITMFFIFRKKDVYLADGG